MYSKVSPWNRPPWNWLNCNSSNQKRTRKRFEYFLFNFFDYEALGGREFLKHEFHRVYALFLLYADAYAPKVF